MHADDSFVHKSLKYIQLLHAGVADSSVQLL